MKGFFSSVKFKILACVLVLLAGTMAWAGANGRLTAAPQEVLSVLLTPVQRLASGFSGGLSSVAEKYASIDATLTENEQLKLDNARLQQQLTEYDKLKAENEAFRSLHNIEENNPDYTYVSCFVIGRDSLERFGGFTVDRGTSQGVEKGDTVVSDLGYLVGVVVEANLTSSKVLTVLSPSFNAAGVISRTRDNGILTGSEDYAGQGKCMFTDLSRDTLATVGDMVVTTGLGGVYPPDIMVGTVEQLIPESSGKSTIAVIAPGESVEDLKHVFIITDY